MDRLFTLAEHLDELRKRVIVSIATFCLATALCIPLSPYLLKIIKLPARDLIEKLVFFAPQDAFLIHMRLAFFAGFAISLPVILYQYWAFVRPAVADKFKGYASRFVLLCSLSFAAGCAFAYFVLIPPAIKFLLSFGGNELEPVISASSYITFITGVILACGLVFQMPVLSLLLTRIGLIDARFLRKKFSIAIVAIFVAAAVITPTTDVINMMLLALPMILLYEVSIWVSRFSGRRT